MNTSSKSLSTSVVSNKKSRTKKSAQPDWFKFKSSLVHLPNPQDAIEHITSYIKSLWNRENVVEYEIAKQKQSDLSKRHKSSAKALDKLEVKVANTEPSIPSTKAHGKESKDGNIKWSVKDVCLVCVTLIGATIAVCLGSANVYANLMAAGLVIFIESEWLAITLSLILPIGSLSIKFLINLFRNDHSRHLFALSVYSVTITLVFVWSYLFAQSFANITGGGVDLENILNGGGANGPLLVWTQLLIEMLAGSSLFIAADMISLKYDPRIPCKNPEYIYAESLLNTHKAAHHILSDELGHLEGQLAAMDADLEATINRHIADFVAYRERVNAANNPNY